VNALYHLPGETVIRIATVSSSESNLNLIQLWHILLGNISEASRTILSERGLLKGLKTRKLDLCEHYIYGKQCLIKFTTLIQPSDQLNTFI